MGAGKSVIELFGLEPMSFGETAGGQRQCED
jgi:hypothetical protein